MSTVAEIKTAIQELPLTDFQQLSAWMEEYQAMIAASQSLFAMYDAEEQEHAES